MITAIKIIKALKGKERIFTYLQDTFIHTYINIYKTVGFTVR